MTFGRHWIAVAAVVPLLLLGACSQDDPQPTFSPPSDSPSATESSPAEPVVQPWEKKTEAGAVAFAKHWVDVLNRVGESGRTADLTDISANNCASCASLVEYIDGVYGDGGRIESDGWEVLQVGDVAPGKTAKSTMSMRVRQSEQRVYRPGEKTAHVAPVQFTVNFGLSWTDGWSMTKAEIIQ